MSQQVRGPVCPSTDSPTVCVQVVQGELVYIRRIGKGSFGEVWLAKWRETHVAVKVLSRPHAADGSCGDERTWPRMIQSMEKASGLLGLVGWH